MKRWAVEGLAERGILLDACSSFLRALARARGLWLLFPGWYGLREERARQGFCFPLAIELLLLLNPRVFYLQNHAQRLAIPSNGGHLGSGSDPKLCHFALREHLSLLVTLSRFGRSLLPAGAGVPEFASEVVLEWNFRRHNPCYQRGALAVKR